MERSTVDKLSSYGKNFQSKLLVCLLSDNDFLMNVIDILNVDYFDSQECKFLYSKIKEYYNLYNSTLTRDAIKMILVQMEDEQLRTAVVMQVRAFKSMENATDLDLVKDKTLSFCKNQALKKALLESVEYLQIGNFEKIRQGITNALNCGLSKDIGKIYSLNFEERYTIGKRKPIPTGWKVVDNALLGGLSKGELGVIIAPTGGGKSWMLTSIGCTALLNGYNVVHYTLELQDLSCELRYDACLTKIRYNELLQKKDVVNDRWIDVYRSKVGGQDGVVGELCMKQYPTRGATMSMLKAHLKMYEMKYGKPDLVIVDYADVMSMQYNRQERSDETLGFLYESLRGMAMEFEVPIWTATQTNREGFSSQIVDHTNVSDSIKKTFVADFIMSLGRTIENREEDTGTLLIMKSRFNKDGMTYDCKLDLGIGRFDFTEKIRQEVIDPVKIRKQEEQNNRKLTERYLNHKNSITSNKE